SGRMNGQGIAAFVNFDQRISRGGGERDGAALLGHFHQGVDVGIGDGGTGGVVNDHVRALGRNFAAGGGDLVNPARAAAEDFDAGEGEVRGVFAFGLFEIFGEEADLNLLDVVAVEKEIDGFEERFAA